MTDPYGVLGVSSSASDDEIKKAYRELARKYHPDNYHDNPLSDLAQEKMKEINEAYDTILKMRGGGSSASSGSYGAGTTYGGQSSGSSSGIYAQVRSAINAGNLSYAESLLNSVTSRSAEWHFLMGSVYYRKGWADEAVNYFYTAVNMEPNNPEYRQALDRVQRGGDVYGFEGGNILSRITPCQFLPCLLPFFCRC